MADEIFGGPPGHLALEAVILSYLPPIDLPPDPCFGLLVSLTVHSPELPPDPCFGQLVSHEVHQLLGIGGITDGFLLS